MSTTVEVPIAVPVEAPVKAKVAKKKKKVDVSAVLQFSEKRVEAHLDEGAAGINRLIARRKSEITTRYDELHLMRKVVADGKQTKTDAEGKKELVDLTEAERTALQARITDTDAEFEKLSEERTQLSRARVRSLQDVPLVVTAVTQYLCRDLLEHSIKQCVAADKKVLHMSMLRTGAESLKTYPLFSTLPSWKQPLSENHYGNKATCDKPETRTMSLVHSIDKCCNALLKETNRVGAVKRSANFRNYMADLMAEFIARIANQLRMQVYSISRSNASINSAMVLQVVRNICVDWNPSGSFVEELQYLKDEKVDPEANLKNKELPSEERKSVSDLPTVPCYRIKHRIRWEGSAFDDIEQFVNRVHLVRFPDDAKEPADDNDVERTFTLPRTAVKDNRHFVDTPKNKPAGGKKEEDNEAAESDDSSEEPEVKPKKAKETKEAKPRKPRVKKAKAAAVAEKPAEAKTDEKAKPAKKARKAPVKKAAAEKVAEKPVEKATEAKADLTDDKTEKSEKSEASKKPKRARKPAEKPAEKATEAKPAEKPVEKATEKPAEKAAEANGNGHAEPAKKARGGRKPKAAAEKATA
jgi:hypothetical protein